MVWAASSDQLSAHVCWVETTQMNPNGVLDNNNNPQSRKRKIMRFNPPFSAKVATPVGRKFLTIIDPAIRCTKYLTETKSKLAIAPCPTSGKSSPDTTNKY